jgi:hypothetical protein
MRLPSVQYPSVLTDDLPYFRPVFQTNEQVKPLCEYATGLMVGDKKTIAASMTCSFWAKGGRNSRWGAYLRWS